MIARCSLCVVYGLSCIARFCHCFFVSRCLFDVGCVYSPACVLLMFVVCGCVLDVVCCCVCVYMLSVVPYLLWIARCVLFVVG